MAEKDILNKVMERFKHSRDSKQYSNWLDRAIEDQNFYDGNQLSKQDLADLEERGQPPIVINEIAPKVDSIIKQELDNQTKTVYKSRSFDPAFEELADGMTTLAINVQENADTQLEMSDVFEDQLLTGIGWLEVDLEEGFIVTPRVDPFMVLWDTDDTTKQLTNSQHVNRMKWYTEAEATDMFIKKSKEIKELVNSEETSDHLGLVGTTRGSSSTYGDNGRNREPFSFVDRKLKKILIVEQQYRKPSTKYRYINIQGQQKETFDEKEANKLSADSEVEEIKSYEIWRAYFTEGILFENIPHEVQIGEFTLIPTVYKRNKEDASPYGLVTNSKDPQRELNKRRSKTMHLLNTRGVVMESGAVDDKNRLMAEISRPDFLIEVNKGKEFDIQDNQSLAESQNRIMFQAKEDISTTMGVFNENIGQQTNATSGVGIQARQAASIGNKAFAFNSFDRFKKRFGRVLGVMMQTVFSEKHMLQVFKEDGSPIMLNKSYEKNGEKYFVNDLSTLFFGVHVKQVPNFEADPEILAANLSNMMMNGQIGMLLQSPSLARRMGISDIEQIQQEVQQAGGLPSPEEAQDGS